MTEKSAFTSEYVSLMIAKNMFCAKEKEFWVTKSEAELSDRGLNGYLI